MSLFGFYVQVVQALNEIDAPCSGCAEVTD